jgi:hypothetical protein
LKRTFLSSRPLLSWLKDLQYSHFFVLAYMSLLMASELIIGKSSKIREALCSSHLSTVPFSWFHFLPGHWEEVKSYHIMSYLIKTVETLSSHATLCKAFNSVIIFPRIICINKSYVVELWRIVWQWMRWLNLKMDFI